MRAGIGRPDPGNERVLSLLLAVPDFEMLAGAIAGTLGPIANRRFLHAFFHGTPPTRVIAVVHITSLAPRGTSSILPQGLVWLVRSQIFSFHTLARLHFISAVLSGLQIRKLERFAPVEVDSSDWLFTLG